MTKSFTAASVLLLIQDRSSSSDTHRLTTPLTLQTPLSSLINFAVPDNSVTVHATLEDALSHRTGMPRHDLSYGGPGFTLSDMVRHMRYLPLTAELRQKFQYCNMMYSAVGFAVEKLSGMWLGTFFRQRIWHPLEMNSTFLSLEDAKRAEKETGSALAKGYYFENSTGYHEQTYFESGPSSGAGAIISTALDFAKYLRALIIEHHFLSKDSYKQLRTPRSIIDWESLGMSFTGPVSYSLGWMISVHRDRVVIHHSGSVPGFGSNMAYLPQEKWGVVAMVNADLDGSMLVQHVTFELMDRFLKTPVGDRVDWIKETEKYFRKKKEAFEGARSRLFPKAPAKGSKGIVSPALLLEKYAKRYFHKGYGEVELKFAELEAGKEKFLYADVANKTLSHRLTMEHVNGEHFLVWMKGLGNTSNLECQAMRGEFRIGSDGRVAEMGIGYEPAMEEEKIWFSMIS
jgi:CubicO group peptidase (beta-lactamase class C family)